MPVIMTGETHCYENAQAERLNGILKQEYGPEDIQNEGRGAACDPRAGAEPPALTAGLSRLRH